MNPHPGPLPSDGRGRVFGRLAGKVAAVHGFKVPNFVWGKSLPDTPLVGEREKSNRLMEGLWDRRYGFIWFDLV